MGEVIYMTTVIRRAFAARLKAARTLAGYEKAKDFAAALGIPAGTYGRWERAEAEPNLDTINLICSTLEVTASFLIQSRTTEKADLLAASDKRTSRRKAKS